MIRKRICPRNVRIKILNENPLADIIIMSTQVCLDEAVFLFIRPLLPPTSTIHLIIRRNIHF